MKKSQTFLSVALIAALIGCGRDDAKHTASGDAASQPQAAEKQSDSAEVKHMSSRDFVKQRLERSGIRVGYDADRGRIVAIETREFSLKGSGSNDNFELTETYDFQDDATDDFETKRFKAIWKAYADGLASIASDLGMSIAHGEENDDAGNVLSKTMSSAATNSLGGVAFLTIAESLDDGWYEVTVAVGQSKIREEAYSRSMSGAETRPGSHSLDEWVKRESERGFGIICPQSYCDNEGVWWRVASVPVDLGTGRNSAKVMVLTERAKRYAYEAALRTIAVKVSQSTSMSFSSDSSERGKYKETIDRTVKIEPLLQPDSSSVRWFDLDRTSPITGKIRLVVAAIRMSR